MSLERRLVDLLHQGVQLWVDDGGLCYRASREDGVPALRETLRRHKAEIVDLLGPGKRYAVPSFPQERQWSLDRMEPADGSYNMPAAWRVCNRLDVAALRAALDEIVRRHEALRTVCDTLDGQLVQVILACPRPADASRAETLPVVDLAGLAQDVREGEVRRLADREARRPFDLAADPMLRTMLLCLSGTPGREEHWLYVNMHHIASDGWSYGVFRGELAALYTALTRDPEARSVTSPLPSLPIRYADFAIWQRQWLSGEVLDRLRGYWRRQLAGRDLVLRLPTDRPRAAVPDYRAARFDFELPESLSRPLRRLSSDAGASLFMTLLSVLIVLLGRMTGQHQVTVGSPVAHRRLRESEGLIGFFADALVLLGDLSADPPGGLRFRDFLHRIRDMTLAAYDHQDLPLQTLVETLRPKRHPDRNPLYQVMLSLHRAAAEDPSIEMAGLALQPVRLAQLPLRLDMHLFCWDSDDDGLSGTVAYRSALFDAVTVERMADRFGRLLSAVVADPDRSLSELPLLGPADEAELRSETGSMDGAVWRRGLRVYPAAMEAALLSLPEVADGAVVRRQTRAGETELVAYVVPAGAFDAERLATRLEDVRSPDAPAGARTPDAWVAVAAVPLTEDGRVDEPALGALEVVDAALIDEIEGRLAALPGVDGVAVVELELARAQPLLHLADVLPGEAWRVESALEPAETDRTRAPADAPVARTRPAVVHGPPLAADPRAPRVLAEVLERAARDRPRHGLVYLGADGEVEHRHTYPELLAEAERTLGGLRGLGLRPQDPVIFQLDRVQDFLPAFWASVLGGFVPVSSSAVSQVRPEDSEVQKLCHASRLLGDPLVLAGGRSADALRALAEHPDMPELRWASIDALRRGPRDRGRHLSEPDELALVLLTSGSTGAPKGVLQSHRALLSQSRGVLQALRFTSDDVSFNWMPIDHVGGLVFSHLRDVVAMARQVHAAKETVLHDPLRWLDSVDRFRVTATWAPNFAFGLVNRLLENGDSRSWDLSTLRLIVNAGEAISSRTARRFLEALAPFGLPTGSMHPAWGMSETCSGVVVSRRFSRASTSDADSFVELGSPVPGMSLRIVDDRDGEVREGTVGHLQVRGAAVTSGYFGREELNREVFTHDGWFRTGDLGFLRDGRLTLTGREKGRIIINGVNYFSHELESVVEQVDGVVASYTAACAVRTPASQTDELAIFFHHPAFRSGAATDAELRQVLAAIRQALARHAGVHPDHLLPVEPEAIPKTSIGKIQSALLSQRFMEGEHDAVRRRIDLLEGRNTLPSWFFKRVWRRRQRGAPRRRVDSASWLVFAARGGLAERIRDRWGERPAVRVEAARGFERLAADHYTIDPAEPEHYRRLLTALADDSVAVSQVLHLWSWDLCDPELGGGDDPNAFEDALGRGLYSLLGLLQAVAGSAASELGLTVVSSRAQATSPAEAIDARKAPLVALLASAGQQFPGLSARHIDLPGEDPAAEAGFVLAELETPLTEPEVALRGGVRQVPRLERYLPTATGARRFERGGFYLLSGGLGGLGFEIARYLLRRFNARLLLVGRTPLPSLDAVEPGTPEALLYGRFQSLTRCGGRVRYAAIDVADGAPLEPLVAELERDFGRPLDGILHLAGVDRQSLLTEETRESVERVLRPKVAGTWWLHRVLSLRKDTWFVGFSSLLSTFGAALAGAYAAANRFLEAYCQQQNRLGETRSLCCSWSLWQDTGMARGSASPEVLERRGLVPLTVDEGIASLLVALAGAEPHLLIGLRASRLLDRYLQGGDPRTRRTVVCWQEEKPANGRNARPALPRQGSLELTDRFGTSFAATSMRLSELPRFAGEIDREALLGEVGETLGAAGKTAPGTPLEERLATLWEELLGVRRPGVHDDFFQLGGHSLLAVQAISRLTEALGIDVPRQLLFQAPTIAQLATSIEELRIHRRP